MIFFYRSTLYTADGSLSWHASSPSPDGYHIYMRPEGQAYDYNSAVWSGAETSCTITHLAANTYYFAAHAYKSDNVSADSNEVEYKGVVNQPPQADAGTDQAVSADTLVTQGGSGSTDPDGALASYQWTQTSGPSVSLSNAAAARASFTAPNVTGGTTLGFQLSVTDTGGLSNTDSCQVTVLPVIPGDSAGGSIGNSAGGSIGTDPTTTNLQTGSTKIWLKAEAGDINAPMVIAGDGNASEGGYIMVPKGTGMISDPTSAQAGYAEYTFNVPSASNYVIWGRVIADDNASNSFFVTMDSGQPQAWHTIVGSVWIWDVVSQRNPGDVPGTSYPLVYHLEPGTHTFKIQLREDGTQLDRMLITNDQNYVPSGTGEMEASTNQKIWIEAEAGDINAPMVIAGDANASGGGYIMVPKGTGMISDPTSAQAGYAEYTFNVPSAGDYVIWGRVIADDNASNFFFVTMDNGPPLPWHTIVGSAWTWDVVSQRNPDDVPDTSHPLVYHLAAGTHTVRLQQREDGTELGRILVTNDTNYVPKEQAYQLPQ